MSEAGRVGRTPVRSASPGFAKRVCERRGRIRKVRVHARRRDRRRPAQGSVISFPEPPPPDRRADRSPAAVASALFAALHRLHRDPSNLMLDQSTKALLNTDSEPNQCATARGYAKTLTDSYIAFNQAIGRIAGRAGLGYESGAS